MMRNQLYICLSISLCLAILCWPTYSFAWGERGHDLVTRVAVKKLDQMSAAGKSFSWPFALRDHMLSHLSNVPDIHWRAPYMSQKERDLNYATHFIGMESIYPKAVSLNDLKTDLDTFYAGAKKAGIDNPERVGTAPWRVIQLYSLMKQALSKAGSADKAAMIDATNTALLYAGIMSHFVGDLANPHHTTINYDGQLSGNTGLHAYFESDIVRELPLKLAGEIEKAAGYALLEDTVLKPYEPARQKQILHSADQLIFALILDSHNRLSTLHELDNQHSLVKASEDASESAIRIPPEQAMNEYRTFASERIAVGASVLAQLWLLAWQDAGKPDLSQFHSYHYHIKPDFIEPSYLNQ